MIDGEGDLATSNVRKRNAAIENHKKWIDAASQMGCHSVRVNLYGVEQKRSGWNIPLKPYKSF